MDASRRDLFALDVQAPDAAKNAAATPKLSLAEWSLHRDIRQRPSVHVELARVAREEFGLEGIEYQTSFFPDKATDFAALADMKKRADDAGVRIVLVEVMDAGGLGADDENERYGAIERHFPWIAAAAFLGCESVSVAAEGFGSGAPYLDWMADSLHRLAAIADAYGVDVLVGNRVGLACDGSWTAALMKKVAHPRVGTHPHADNFDLGGGHLYSRYLGVQEMLPWAKAFSARSYEFDANGDEPRVDFERLARSAAASGYAGWIGIEYDGPGLPERDGIVRTIALARRAFGKPVVSK
jgi:sugar phosphate isomerase/epimerase